MSSTAFFLLLVATTPYNTFATNIDVSIDVDADKHPLLTQFKEWVLEFEKEYENDDKLLERFTIWSENDAYINTHNSKIPRPSFTVGHNQFSDLTNEEYQRYNFLGEYSTPPQALPKIESVMATTRVLQDAPKSVNWIEEGAVTPVKNQGKCGSCWSFSATTAVESAMFLKTGELVALSEQQLLDCDTVDLACKGGLMDQAFTYIEGAGGLCSNSSYPYEEKKQTCQVDNCDIVEGSDVISFIDVDGNEESLMAAVAEQPVSIAIEADKMSFQLYKEGVYDSRCGVRLDHGVVAVGYGTDEESGKDYWLVRNSWGPKWGDSGNIKIDRQGQTAKGRCGIYECASRPVVE